jgi:ABC-type Fe3+-hydroxamate transport system substrate-binding protein
MSATQRVYSYRHDEVEIPKEPKKIVSFSPSITEILFGIGLSESIAGISAFCVRPPETNAEKRIGSYVFVKREILDEIQPDLIFTISGYRYNFTAALAKNYSVVCMELSISVAGIIDLPIRVGAITGRREQRRNLAYSLMAYLPHKKRRLLDPVTWR